jgi:hypothetical protein
MEVFNEWEMMVNEATVPYFMTLSRNLPVDTEENRENFS